MLGGGYRIHAILKAWVAFKPAPPCPVRPCARGGVRARVRRRGQDLAHVQEPLRAPPPLRAPRKRSPPQVSPGEAYTSALPAPPINRAAQTPFELLGLSCGLNYWDVYSCARPCPKPRVCAVLTLQHCQTKPTSARASRAHIVVTRRRDVVVLMGFYRSGNTRLFATAVGLMVPAPTLLLSPVAKRQCPCHCRSPLSPLLRPSTPIRNCASRVSPLTGHQQRHVLRDGVHADGRLEGHRVQGRRAQVRAARGHARCGLCDVDVGAVILTHRLNKEEKDTALPGEACTFVVRCVLNILQVRTCAARRRGCPASADSLTAGCCRPQLRMLYETAVALREWAKHGRGAPAQRCCVDVHRRLRPASALYKSVRLTSPRAIPGPHDGMKQVRALASFRRPLA